MIIVSLALIYYCFKYYQQGQLFFTQNQFQIFVMFALIVFWIFGYLIWQNSVILKQNSKLINNNETINDLLNLILANNKDLVENINNNTNNNHYKIVQMNQNTRVLIKEMFDLKGQIGNDK